MNRLLCRGTYWRVVAVAVVVVAVICLWLFQSVNPRVSPDGDHEALGKIEQTNRLEQASEPFSSLERVGAMPDVTPVILSDATGSSGITFQHTDGSSGRRYIVEAMSAGVATFDYDGDGWIDIYFVNGALLPGALSDVPPRNALYRNLGGFKFQDVTEHAGVGDAGFGLGVVAGDYDDDGWPDLYVNNFGANVLYRNQGDGTFSDATRQAGAQRRNLDLVGAGTCFLDADRDGDLDLYCGNYMEFTFDRHMIGNRSGFPSSPSPAYYDPAPDTLFSNRGDGTFVDASETSGIGRHAGRSMGMVLRTTITTVTPTSSSATTCNRTSCFRMTARADSKKSHVLPASRSTESATPCPIWASTSAITITTVDSTSTPLTTAAPFPCSSATWVAAFSSTRPWPRTPVPTASPT